MDESEKVKFSKIELEEEELVARVKPVNVSIETGVCRDQPHIIESRSGTVPAPEPAEILEEIELIEEEEGTE